MAKRMPPPKTTRYFFGAPTRHQAKRLAWRDFLELVPDWIPGGKYGPNVSYGELRIRCVFPGSHTAELCVLGLDNAAAVVEGDGWDGCVIDESSDIWPSTFSLSVRPALADRGGWAWLIGIPKRQGVGARDYRAFCERCLAGEYPDGACFSWPSSEILSAEELAHARATLDPKDFREQFEACWETAGGGIYHAFSREEGCGNIQPCERRDNMPICVGSDFNVDPMCWVLCHRIGDDLEVFDELVLHDSNTPQVLNELWRRWGHHQGGWQFYGDPSSRARKTSATQSDYAHIWNDQRFQKARRTLHYPSGPPAVEDRYSAVNARLCNADETRRLFIDPRCTTLIEDLETCSYREGTREPAFDKDHFHASDALGYVISRIWPLRFNVGGGKQAVIVGERPAASGINAIAL